MVLSQEYHKRGYTVGNVWAMPLVTGINCNHLLATVYVKVVKRIQYKAVQITKDSEFRKNSVQITKEFSKC